MPFEQTMNRLIYKYHDGDAEVAADPDVLWRRLNLACVDKGLTWEALVKRWGELIPQATLEGVEPEPYDPLPWLEFQGIVAEVMREAFGLKALDASGSGLTEAETVGVLVDFTADREKKGPPTDNSPSSSGSTDGAPKVSSRRSSARSNMNTSTV